MIAINALCVVVSAWIAYDMFKSGLTTMGWLNVFASGLNLAIIISSLTGVL